MSKKKIISLAVGVIIVAGIAIWAFGGQAKKRKVVYGTATVDRANISNSVTGDRSGSRYTGQRYHR